MSQNIYQIFQANPASSMISTDILYLGRSPYNTTDDFAITFANFVASIGVTTPTASTIPLWDANKNLSANNFLSAYTTTATAAATTTLTVASTFYQFFTGATTQTVIMPVTSTLVLGQSYLIVNNSSGVVTVESSGTNTIQAMAANTQMEVVCIGSGTTAASWQILSYGSSDVVYPIGIPFGGTGVTSVTISPTASSFAGWDANKNLSANNFLPGWTTTATAASTTTLVVGSTYYQQFTGSTTQTVAMPVTSTLVLGQTYTIINDSTGVVTVQSSGLNTIQALAANTTLTLAVQAITGTTAASWQVLNYGVSDTTYPLAVALGGTGSASVVSAPAATAWAGWDANKNLSAVGFIAGYATTVTSASPVTLVVGSAQQQYFTGSNSSNSFNARYQYIGIRPRMVNY